MAFVMPLGWCTKKNLAKFLQDTTSYFSSENKNVAYLRYGVNISCFWQLCVVLCYLEFSVKIGFGRRISLFRGRIGTIGLKQVENQVKPNKCDFCTLLIMLYFCTENERNLFSIENRPVGFYTECLLMPQEID